MDHDRLFKELLTTFFVEFVALFLPDVTGYVDPSSIEFLDKEIFTDITAGERHEVDLLVKARFQGHDAFFLVHVETQSKSQAEFPKRMFTYCARLHEKFDLPVYPVALFSYDSPLRPEPNFYRIAFPDITVLQFEYRVIQLNRLDWRAYVATQNPVASALMAKMQIAPTDRAKVKAECLRLMATLRLDPAKAKLIGGFVDSYLTLTAAENTQYEREISNFTPEEREATMEIITSWELKALEQGRLEGRQTGRQEGRQEGKEELLVRLIKRRFGEMSGQIVDRLDQLSSEQLNDLGDALLDFKTSVDLVNWLSERFPQ